MVRRRRVEPTEEWAELELLLEWPEQVEYERIRPTVVFGGHVATRSRQTGTPETTLRRRIASFEHEGIRGLLGPEQAAGKSALAPQVRRLILDLKTEHPPMRNNEIATVCYVRFGRRPHGRTVRKAIEAGPTAIRMFRCFAPYHEIPDATERRLAIVTLHAEGWNMKSIAGYLKTSRPTVYRTLKKWITEGVRGLEDKPRGAKRKADLRAMNEVRKLQENPELGEFRVSAALERLGIFLSPRTCGRILAVNRKLYGFEKPKRGSKKKEMPFQSSRRHEIWSVDVRYLDHNLLQDELPGGGKVYSISVLENHSRALLASALSTSQDQTSSLISRHGRVVGLAESRDPGSPLLPKERSVRVSDFLDRSRRGGAFFADQGDARSLYCRASDEGSRMDATKGDAMGKTVLPAAVLTVMLAATLVLAAPAYPQAASSGNPAANEEGNLAAPRPPEYQVTEDGGLIIGGDIRGDCAAIGRADPTERFADPSARVQMERADNEAARACEAAGFSTAADGVSSSALPETGGAPPLPLAGLLLLAGVVGLVALRRTG